MTDRTKQQHGKIDILTLIVVVITIGFVAVVLLPHAHPLRKTAMFAACRADLSGIGKAMLAYQEQDRGNSMPLIKLYEAVPNGANSTPTEANRTHDPYSSGQWETTLGDQAMQNVWLLIESQFLNDEGIFHCGGDAAWDPREERRYGRPRPHDYGWTDPHQYSYGMQWPYDKDAAGNANPAVLGVRNTAMLADHNPGGPVDDYRPPSNHPKRGTNLLLASGGVKASRTMVSTIGPGGDEIYTNAAGVAGGLPQSDEDTSITLSGR